MHIVFNNLLFNYIIIRTNIFLLIKFKFNFILVLIYKKLRTD